MNRTVATAVSAATIFSAAGWLYGAGAFAQSPADQATASASASTQSGVLVAQNNVPAAGTGATTAQNTGAAGGDQLQEVVVTAERRAENVQTTPIAVNAISGTQLQQEHVNSLEDLPTVAPIGVTDSGWHQQVNIRGIGNAVISASINIGIAVIRDGLFEAETLGQAEPLYDIADTEVLRGPQGTFVGYASTGGAVEINSANPNFRGVNGYVQAGVGNYTDRTLQGAVNLPASSTLALRFAFNMETRNSFYKDIGSIVTGGSAGPAEDPGNVDNKEARFSLLWKPADSFQALFKSAYDNEQSDGLPSQVDPGTFTEPCAAPTGACTPGGVVHAPYYSASTGEPFVLNANRLDQQFDTQKNETGLEMRFTFPDQIVLRSMTGFEQISVQLNQDSDATNSSITNGVEAPGLSTALAGFPIGGSINACSAATIAAKITGDCGQWQYRVIPPDDYYSQELDLLSPTNGRFNWIVGATVFYRDTPVDSITYEGTTPYSPTNPEYSDSSTHSIERLGGEFGQINWQLTDTLQLQVGARDNWDSNYGTGNSETYNPLTNATSYSGSANGVSCKSQGFTQYGCITRTFKDTVPTGKVDLNWTPVQGQFFYAFFARGYQAGGINSDNTTFQPEHVNDWELGWKGNYLDNHVQTQLGGYWMAFQNYQYSLTSPVSGISDVINLPTATIEGIEASMQAHVAQVDFDAGIYYNKTALGSFTAVEAYKLPTSLPANTPGCAAGVATPANYSCFNYAPYEVTLSGAENAFSPPLTANADLGYRIPLAAGTLEPRVTFSHTDRQYGSIFQNDTYYLMGARNLWGADIDYTAGPWLVDAYGTNLTNESYIAGYYGAGGNLNDVFYGAPRQYGLRLNYTF